MKIVCLCVLMLLAFNVSAQQTDGEQLRMLMKESKQFFSGLRGKDSLDNDSNHVYQSKMLLSGTSENTFTISKDGESFAFFHALIADSISLKGAKKAAQYWRTLVELNLEGFVEDKSKRKTKGIVMGDTHYSHQFLNTEGKREYSVTITYVKRYVGDYYLMYLQLGHQRF